MRRFHNNIFAAFFLITLIGCAEETPPPETPLDDYFSALAATTHGEATENDIDRLMLFYAEDVIYEHPRVGVKIEGVEAQRRGAVALRESYGGAQADSSVEVLEYIGGPDVDMVRIKVRFIANREGALDPVEREQWRVIERKDGKITRIIDYW